MTRRPLPLLAAALSVALAACSDSSSPSLIADSEVTADVATTSGDAMAADVQEMLTTEATVGPALPAPAFDLFSVPGLNVTRTRTCFDATHTAQASCNATTTATIEFTLLVEGSFSGSRTGPRGTESATFNVHRNRALVISGLAGTETFRLFDGNGSSNDTTTFTATHEEVTTTRVMAEAAQDSAQGVRFNLPHATNPWPVAGVLIRNVSGKVTVTRGEDEETRDYTRRVTVTFPADAQGNVAITINGKNCTLNLVTRTVANCQI